MIGITNASNGTNSAALQQMILETKAFAEASAIQKAEEAKTYGQNHKGYEIITNPANATWNKELRLGTMTGNAIINLPMPDITQSQELRITLVDDNIAYGVVVNAPSGYTMLWPDETTPVTWKQHTLYEISVACVSAGYLVGYRKAISLT